MAAKLFFALLVLVAVVFFFTIRMGSRRNDSQSLPESEDERTSYAQKNPPPAWIGNLIGPLSPKLSLPQKEFHFTATDLVVDVPAAGPRFRNASLQVTSGCMAPTSCSNVVILYQIKDGEGQDLKLDTQSWKPSADKPSQASLVILQSGGTIRMRCLQAPACTVKLQ